MTQQPPEPADGVRAPDEPSDQVERATQRTADDPFDRKRLERLKGIADPEKPDADPLADVDTTSVSPGDGGTTGPDEMIDLDWDVDVTLEGDLADDRADGRDDNAVDDDSDAKRRSPDI